MLWTSIPQLTGSTLPMWGLYDTQPTQSLLLCTYVDTMVFIGVTSDHQWSSNTHMIIHHHLQPPPTAQQLQ